MINPCNHIEIQLLGFRIKYTRNANGFTLWMQTKNTNFSRRMNDICIRKNAAKPINIHTTLVALIKSFTSIFGKIPEYTLLRKRIPHLSIYDMWMHKQA